MSVSYALRPGPEDQIDGSHNCGVLVSMHPLGLDRRPIDLFVFPQSIPHNGFPGLSCPSS